MLYALYYTPTTVPAEWIVSGEQPAPQHHKGPKADQELQVKGNWSMNEMLTKAPRGTEDGHHNKTPSDLPTLPLAW